MYSTSKIEDLVITALTFDDFELPGYTAGDSGFSIIDAEH